MSGFPNTFSFAGVIAILWLVSRPLKIIAEAIDKVIERWVGYRIELLTKVLFGFF